MLRCFDVARCASGLFAVRSGKWRTEPIRKSTLEPAVGSEAKYMDDSVTEHTENLLISSGENTPKSTARMYSRGGAREDGMATATGGVVTRVLGQKRNS